MYSLTRRKGIRIGSALALVAMAAFCVFQAYLLVYLNRSAFASVPRTAGDLQNRTDAYAWAGSLLEVGAAPVLVPVFPLRQGEGRRSIALQVVTRYLPAIVISTFGTAGFLLILMWMFRSLGVG
jgi:hypothetical protein